MSERQIAKYYKFLSFSDLQSQIEIPSIQRNLNKEVVNEIYNYIYSCLAKLKEPVFGTLDLVSIGGSKMMYLTDGQHRFEALKNIYENLGRNIPVHTMIYNVQNYEEMEEIFKIRNRGIPMPDYYLDIKNNITKRKDLVKEIENLVTQIPIVKIANCNRPFLNRTNFINAFTNSSIFSLINNVDDFNTLLSHINQKCCDIVSSMDDKHKKRKGISDKMIKVWDDCGWYLSYDLNFPYFNDTYREEYSRLFD